MSGCAHLLSTQDSNRGERERGRFCFGTNRGAVVNRKRIFELAEVIRRTPYEGSDSVHIEGGIEKPKFFNMTYTHCGTLCCLCGWACTLWPSEVKDNGDLMGEGGKILGLDSFVSDALFLPDLQSFTNLSLDDITPEEAATVLERVLEQEPEDGVAMTDIWKSVLDEHRSDPAVL